MKKGADPLVCAFCLRAVHAGKIGWKICNQEFASARIHSRRARHLIHERRQHPEGIEMTKIVTLAAAFVLFTPVAIATLMQAAQIVA